MAIGGQDVIGDLMVRLHADTARYTNALNAAEAKAEKTTGRITTVFAKGAAVMGGAMAAYAAVAVRQFANFDDAMTKSAAIMTDMNSGLRSDMERTARSLAQNGIQSADQLAEAYFFLASAGLDAKQSMAALPVVQSFATAGAFDMAKATDLLTDAQSALGLSVSDTTENMRNMTRVSDVLVKANTLSNATVEQFSEALTNKAGAQLRRFNKDVEEGASVLAVFADQGVKGKRAGEGLSIVLRELERGARENKEAWEEYNLSVFDSEGNVRNMSDIISDMEGNFEGLSDEMLGARLASLGFTAETQSYLAMLLGTSEAMTEYEQKLRDVSGITKDIAENQLTSFSAQMQILRNRMNDFNLTVGENLVPILLQLTEGMRSGEGALNDYDSAANKVGRTIQTTLLTSMMVISDAWYGWHVLIKTGEVLILAFFNFFGKRLAEVEQNLVGFVNRGIEGINKLIEGYNRVNFFQKDKELLDPMEWSKATDLSDALAASLALANDELGELIDKGRPSTRILETYGANANAQINDMNQGGLGSVKGRTPGMDTPSWAMPGISNSSGWDMQQAIVDPMEEVEKEHAGIFDRMLKNSKEFFTESNQLAMSQMALQLDGMTSMFGAMVGESSGAYKALFAIQKAFAIASAIVAVNNAIANASTSAPFPANLASMASVAAATLGLVGTIASTVVSFEGGGYTGSGPRAGGLDGKGGFMAMLHPQERVIDDHLGTGGANVTVNNYSNASVDVVDREGELEFIIREAENRLAAGIARGGSPLARTMESAYRMKRGLK